MRQRFSESDVAGDLFRLADSDIFGRLMKGISDLTISEKQEGQSLNSELSLERYINFSQL